MNEYVSGRFSLDEDKDYVLNEKGERVAFIHEENERFHALSMARISEAYPLRSAWGGATTPEGALKAFQRELDEEKLERLERQYASADQTADEGPLVPPPSISFPEGPR